MKKNGIKIGYVLLFLFLSGTGTSLYATHQKAAEIIVQYVSGYTYRAKLYTYTFTQSPADRPEIEIQWGDGTSSILQRTGEAEIGNDTKLNYYEGLHTYAGPGVYVLSMEDPNRNSGVVNVPNSVMTPMFVSTTLTISPWLGAGNNSPVATRPPVADNACLGQTYVHNPDAYDPDGDIITYKLVPCRGEGGDEVPAYTYPYATDTFYMDAYSGNLVWDAPAAQGEYNVSFLMEEWRNAMKIGEVTRDMQIIVRACDNTPPRLVVPEDICVEAGERLYFEVTVLDSDGDMLSLEFGGELEFGGRAVGLQLLYGARDTAVYGFFWQTDLRDSRENPYILYFRAEDNGDPHLSMTETVSVKVMAPAVEFAESGAEQGGIGLHWHPSTSPHAISYALYRKETEADEILSDSCRTGLADSNYVLLAEIPLADTSYLDGDVEEGRRYCYRIFSAFSDESESRPSDPLCLETRNSAPLITRISVEKTDVSQGVNHICWVAPRDTGSEGFGNGLYRLYRGTSPDSVALVAEMPFDSAVCYRDSSLSTSRIRYFYQVSLDTFASSRSSSVFLSGTARAGRIDLQWVSTQAWYQKYFDVYRAETGAEDFVRVARVEIPAYTDEDVVPEVPYLYYVEAVGTYGSERIPDMLHNRSNEMEAVALMPEPCKPYLFLLQTVCEPLKNVLVWSFDSLYNPFAPPLQNQGGLSPEQAEECDRGVDHYEIYRRRSSESDFMFLSSTMEKRYEDGDPGALFCQYQVVAVGKGQDAETGESGILNVDAWDCFRYNLPNVFTPNGDGVNDVWRAIDPQFVEDFELRVVNRWGVEVFRSQDPLFEWNGKLGNKGKDCPDGPYFYYAEFSARIEGRIRRKEQSGSVTVLR